MLRFERFLEDLSNWYLRRSRRRFWKSESDTDKLAAFTTLYDVLEGVCRVMAPILPFLTEEIYQNIVRGVNQQAPVSIHLCDYPEYEPDKVDEELATRIDVVVKYKNLGLGLRNQSGLKVRQPLARVAVCPGDQAERSALSEESLQSQLLTELNIKQLELLDSTEGMLKTEVRPDFKTLGPKYGRMMKGIQSALTTIDPSSIESKLASDSSYTLEVEGSTVILTPEDLEIRHTAPDGLAFTVQEGAFVAIETAITPELKREGIARDFVRGVQNVRKEIDLNVADRIHLRFHTENEETVTAIDEWRDYISRETLAREITDDDQLSEATAHSFKVAGTPVLVAIEVVGQ
jgi:isoleucyl-tRNA synthetase